MKKVTKSATLEKILEQRGAEEVLAKNGVPCIFCPLAKLEMDKLQIGQVCEMYSLNLEKILKELNDTLDLN